MSPLTYQFNDTRDQPLTPSHLLRGRDISIMPPLLQSDTNDSTTEAKELRHQYFLLSNALDRFRKRWSSKYLTSLHEKHINHCAEKPMHQLKPGSLIMVCHENLHRYEWPLRKVVRVFPDTQGIIRSVEVEEGGRVSLRSVSFLVPLELDCHDGNEGNVIETETTCDSQEVSYSKADEPPLAATESICNRHEVPMSLGINSSSSLPSESPQAASAVMQSSGLEETHHHETADIPNRDSESPPPCSDVGATPSITTEPRAAASRQSHAPSRESANLSDAQPDEPTMQRQQQRAATRQRQLIQELMQQDLL